MRHGLIAVPEAAAPAFVRIRFERDEVRRVGNAAGMLWRTPSREAGAGQIEAAPEEMNGTAFAQEVVAEQLQHAIGLCQDLPVGARVAALVLAWTIVTVEALAIG